MQILKPILDTSLEILSTNVGILENAWAPGDYTLGDLVQVNDLVYSAVQDLDINAPAPGEATDPAEEYWAYYGVTNPFKPFDGLISSKLIGPPKTSYILSISELSGGVAFLGMQNITSIFMSMRNSLGDEVYSTTVDLLDPVLGLYNSDKILLDLPPYTNVEVTIDLFGDVELLIGVIIFGRVYDIGIPKYGGSSSIIDYSTKDTDTFGNFIVEQKPFSRRMNSVLTAESSTLDQTLRLLTGIRATPVVWITTENDDYSTILVVYGFYRDFSISIPHCDIIQIDVSVEGLSEGGYLEGFTWDGTVWRYRRETPEYWVALVTADDSHTVMWDDITVLGGEPSQQGLVNESAETVIIAPWISETGVWGQRNDLPKPPVGYGDFYFESSGSQQCLLSQETDIVAAGIHIYNIDTNQVVFNIDFWQNALGAGYLGGVFLRYLDSVKSLISESIPVMQNYTSWTAVNYSDRLPAGTRFVEVVLRADVYSGNAGAFFDYIDATSIVSPITLTDSKGRTYFELSGYRYTSGLIIKG